MILEIEWNDFLKIFTQCCEVLVTSFKINIVLHQAMWTYILITVWDLSHYFLENDNFDAEKLVAFVYHGERLLYSYLENIPKKMCALIS